MAKNEAIEFLLGKGMDLNSTNNKGNTALHFAVIKGQDDTVEFHLGQGINRNERNSFGKTALDVTPTRAHFPVCQILEGLE